MMTKDVMELLLIKYSNKQELREDKLRRLVYLVDWEYTKKYKKQLTEINWSYELGGPYSFNILDVSEGDPNFTFEVRENMYGCNFSYIRLNKKGNISPKLSKDVRRVIYEVIRDTKSLSWDSFIYHVHQTAPIRTSNIYGPINLGDFVDKEEGTNEK